MSTRNLDVLFSPRSIAVLGASNREHSVGATVMHNLLRAGFEGPIMPVNPKHRSVAGVLAYGGVADLPVTPELAVICTPPASVPGLVAELGARGTKAAVVLTAGLSAPMQDAMLQAARPHLMRLVGPNCVGLLAPGARLNASFAHTEALPGKLAFVSQSGALCTAILDWARTGGIGFSCFVSLGNGADVDFGDVLDWLGSDPETDAILLYVEAIGHARKFMSAARAAARNKPVIAVKAGRVPEGARAATSHTGALAGHDEVYDAAFRRAGMLRVLTVEDLFAAVETLGRARPLPGERLAILTNGGGPGVMATDALVASGGRLAPLEGATLRALDAILPPTWSHANPVDVIGDAPVQRYVGALRALLADAHTDAVLLIHCPTAIVPIEDIAHAVAAEVRGAAKNVLACWLGGAGVRAAREITAAAGVPTFRTPEAAVAAFRQIVDYHHNQEVLLETPAAQPDAIEPDVEGARAIVQRALHDGREMLSEPESKQVLAAFGIPVVATRVVRTPREAAAAAAEIGFPVALKVLSPQVSHKSDVGGVALDLGSGAEVETAAGLLTERLRALAPGAELSGFTVQEMARRPGAQELIAGAVEDPVFGPVILFGHGGTAVEVIADRAVALPPLNMSLARDLVERTRVARLLRGYRDRPAADLDAVCGALVQLAQLVATLPEVVEVDVNPLLADERGVLALDARVRVTATPHAHRLAIRPYPKLLEERAQLGGREILLRPIRPEDASAHREFLAALTPQDSRFRFFGAVRMLPLSQLARSTQIDYEREMTFVAIGAGAANAAGAAGAAGDTAAAGAAGAAGQPLMLGVVTAATDPDNARADFAIVVRSGLEGRGLGRLLLEKMVRYLRSRGTKVLVGQVPAENERMLALARDLGFARRQLEGEPAVEVSLELA